MSRERNLEVEEVGKFLLRLALLALLVAGLLKVVTPEYMRLRDEFGWGVMPVRISPEGDNQIGGRCGDSKPAGRTHDPGRRAVTPRRPDRKN
jgi:hypothetical protein